jgi:hypothetical protein
MAGRHTAKESFSGETWRDDDGQTFAFDVDDVRVRVRFLDDGKIQMAILGAPPMEIMPAPWTMLGTRTENTWAKIMLEPTAK